jgi:hypothetical protein
VWKLACGWAANLTKAAEAPCAVAEMANLFRQFFPDGEFPARMTATTEFIVRGASWRSLSMAAHLLVAREVFTLVNTGAAFV